MVADDIRTVSAEKPVTGKNYRLKTKKKKKEKFVERTDQPKAEAEAEAKDTDTDMKESVVNEELQEQENTEKKTEMTQEVVEEPREDKVGDKEVENTVREDVKKEEPVIQDSNLGSVEGKILHNRSPLRDCQVKLQMLEKGGLLAKGYRPVDGAIEIETVTDENGIYHFANVSPGLYKLFWKPPSETSWVRRFKMEPDVIVEPGKVTNPKDVETLKRTLN